MPGEEVRGELRGGKSVAMPKIWRFAAHDETEVRGLSAALKISPLMAQVLAARGLTTTEEAAEFLDAKLTDLHDPERLPGIPAAVDRILDAIRQNRRITIYGDYDVDGVTATSLLWHCLRLCGAQVDYYIPSRIEEGYGLNVEAVEQFHADDPDRLVITVDCGIASVAEADRAKELDLELIVTDHHHFGEHLPAAAVNVHPRLHGTAYPFGDLCGAGVAFKLAWAVCKRLGDGKKATPPMREYLKTAVGLAAIGTVADVVPLLGENRILVHYGLHSLVERGSEGLKALMRIAGIAEKKVLSAEDIGFAIAPRINAAGRLGQARLAVELLTTDNSERAVALADYLDQLNKSRRTVERRIFRQAKELVADHPAWDAQPVLVLAHPDWHVGVIGIVANRVAEHFQKPAVLISLEAGGTLGRGSGRSFAGFDLHAGLTACAEHLTSFGGHRAAAGLKIEEEAIAVFREQLCDYADRNHTVTPSDLELRVDAEVRLADVTHRAVKELDRLGPFGRDNPRPIFAATRVELAEPPRTMGEGDRHLSLRVRQYGRTLRAIAFGRGEWAAKIAESPGPIAISFAASINHFRGRENVELQLHDWQAEPSSATAVVVPPARATE